MYKISIVVFAIAFVCNVSVAQERSAAPKGPPPRFITVKTVDPAKQAIIVDVQAVAINMLDRPTMLVFPDGSTRYTLGTDPSYVYLADGGGFKVSLKNAKWNGVDGKEIKAETAVKQLKPGAMVILSANGAAIDPAYLNMFKEGTLVLVLPQAELPVPYIPGGSSAILNTHLGGK